MANVSDALASFERNIEAQTGKSVEAWAALVGQQGFVKHGQMVAWLKADHGLSHSHANHVAKRALSGAVPVVADDSVAHVFAGAKAGLRPLYEQIVTIARTFGDDVEIAPKKANVSLRSDRQFALVQPSTNTRLDIGLILKGKTAAGRLEPSGSFNAMFTHRVRLSSADEIDDELRDWLHEAYLAARKTP